jgi:hypothetical protein
METLVKIQNELKVPKGNLNKFGNYKYRSAEDILEAVKPLLVEQGLTLTISDDIILVGDRFYVKATATVTDGKESVSTTAFARESLDKKGMDTAQITGASSSYARKYALNGLFCIDDTKDSDATNKHDKYEEVAQEQREAFDTKLIDATTGKDAKWMTSQTRTVIMDLKKKLNINDDGFRDRVHKLYNTSFEGLLETEALDLIKRMSEIK